MSAMAGLGCTFVFRACKDPQQGDGVTAWTSLEGASMENVLRHLPVAAIVGGERGAAVEKLWKDFMALLDRVDDHKPGADLDQLQADLIVWMTSFLRLYGNADITPYLHIFVCHAVDMVRRHGALRRFKCQTAEKLNNCHQKAWCLLFVPCLFLV